MSADASRRSDAIRVASSVVSRSASSRCTTAGSGCPPRSSAPASSRGISPRSGRSASALRRNDAATPGSPLPSATEAASRNASTTHPSPTGSACRSWPATISALAPCSWSMRAAAAWRSARSAAGTSSRIAARTSGCTNSSGVSGRRTTRSASSACAAAASCAPRSASAAARCTGTSAPRIATARASRSGPAPSRPRRLTTTASVDRAVAASGSAMSVVQRNGLPPVARWHAAAKPGSGVVPRIARASCPTACSLSGDGSSETTSGAMVRAASAGSS